MRLRLESECACLDVDFGGGVEAERTLLLEWLGFGYVGGAGNCTMGSERLPG